MKLKDFKETSGFKIANIVKYFDTDNQEIDLPKTEVQRRRFWNRQVVDIRFYERNIGDTSFIYLDLIIK